MARDTNVSWADSTFNPWWGCQRAGPGCAHCYAEALDKRTGGQHWGPGAARRRTSVKNWNDPVRWNKQPFFECQGCGRRGTRAELEATDERECNCHKHLTPARQRVFCASMADVFDNEVPVEWRADLFDLIAKTPNLDWLLLTKRIGNAHAMLEDAIQRLPDARNYQAWSSREWPNVWLGATIVNQEEADRDIPKLLAVPASKRFLSMEPLLGPVDLTAHCPPYYAPHLRSDRIGWVIAGFESGPNARPGNPDHARSLRDQCQETGVPYHFKQNGEWLSCEIDDTAGDGFPVRLSDGYGIQLEKRRYRTMKAHGMDFVHVGTKAAGRLLDGVLYHGFPT